MASERSGEGQLRDSGWLQRVPFLAEGGHLRLLREVQRLRRVQTVYPAQEDLLRALRLTPPQAVRVVILGQDPYHGEGQAHGLAFSVPADKPLPRSLGNIFKEIQSDVDAGAPLPDASPDLTRWARQGVLLLNTVLSVAAGKAHSHARLNEDGGWQALTHAVLEAVARGSRPVAVLLWGRPAQAFAPLFATSRHLVLCAAHPSPLSASRGFFGCRHFSRVNAWLRQRGEEEIRW